MVFYEFTFAELALDHYFVGVETGKEFLKSDLLYLPGGKQDSLIRSANLSPNAPAQRVDFTVERALVVRGTVGSLEKHIYADSFRHIRIGGVP